MELALAVDHLAKTLDEFARLARFRKDRGERLALHGFAQRRLADVAERDDGNVPCARVPLQIVKKRPAVL